MVRERFVEQHGGFILIGSNPLHVLDENFVREEKESYGFIYKVKNLEDGTLYIGKTTKSIRIRFKDHVRAANRGSPTHFHRALRIYRSAQFELSELCHCSSEEDLTKAEICFLSYYRTKDLPLYNTSFSSVKKRGPGEFKNNPRKGSSLFLQWVKKYGEEEAQRKLQVWRSNHSRMMKSHNPMFGRSFYDCWVERYGKEVADRLLEEYKLRKRKSHG